MKKPLVKICIAIDRFTETTGKMISCLTVFMMILMVSTVLARYLFGIGSIAMQESVLYLHAIVFMLGAAYTLKHDDHVRVDIFYRQMPQKYKHMVNLAGGLLFLLPVSLFIAWQSLDYVAAAWQRQESSQDPGGLSWLYLLKTLLLVMPSLLVIQGVGEVIRHSLALAGTELPHDENSSHLQGQDGL